MLTRIIRVSAVAITVAVVAGCATGQAVRSAQTAADKGDWDSAVAYYRQALNSDPSRIDIKLALERSMRNASTDHLKRARAFEQQDQLSGAAAEYRLAADLDPGNTLAITKALEIERKIRDQIEASRPRARIDDLRQQAAQASPIPRLDPRVKVTANFNGAVKDLLTFIAGSTGINITYDQIIPTINSPYQINLADASLEDALNQIMTANTLTYKVNGPRTHLRLRGQPGEPAEVRRSVRADLLPVEFRSVGNRADRHADARHAGPGDPADHLSEQDRQRGAA